MTSLDRTVARLMRALRSRSKLRPVVLFCLGVLAALLGMAFGLSSKSPPPFAVLAIFAGVALGALAVAAVMLRPDAANDNSRLPSPASKGNGRGCLVGNLEPLLASSERVDRHVTSYLSLGTLDLI